MNNTFLWMTILVIALVTALLRFLPFLVFRSESKIPRLIDKLGRTLPHAVMGMLVVYCMKDMHFQALSGFLPMIIATAIVALLYLWKRNTLFSIIAGTLSYMFLVQMVF